MALALAVTLAMVGQAGLFPAPVAAQLLAGDPIQFTTPDVNQPVSISASRANRWSQDGYEVWLLSGDCVIRQGHVTARSGEAVLWLDRANGRGLRPNKLVVYLEGETTVDYAHSGDPLAATGKPANTISGRSWLGRFYTILPVQLHVPPPGPEPAVKPALFLRAAGAWNPTAAPVRVRPVQFTTPAPAPNVAGPLPAGDSQTLPPQTRRIRVRPRDFNSRVEFRWLPNPQRNEWVAVINSGVNVVIDGAGALDIVDASADRVVIWTKAAAQPDLASGALISPDSPLEIYLEGNIVFRQGDRRIDARAMYLKISQEPAVGQFGQPTAEASYSVERGVVLEAEMLTPVPSYEGLLRLKADVLQQQDRNNFRATGASLTSSRLGVPSYWFQSQTIDFQDEQHPRINPFTGQPEVNPATGNLAVEHELLATSRNNFVYVGGLPVLYWPFFATDARKPNYYIDGLSFRNDSVFGTQVLADFDMYQVLGIQNPLAGTEWQGSVDYLSERGLGLGTNFGYSRQDFFGIQGPVNGFVDAWGIKDHGFDNLGSDRRMLTPEEEFRGRLLIRHRQEFGNGFQLTKEVGLISDRNFLQQYYENEWDQLKDQNTGLELKQTVDNWSWSVMGEKRLNDFFTQTDWLPRADHFLLGESLLADKLTWYAHSNVGYARLRTASTPTDPADAASFELLPWEVQQEGIRAATRQEIDLPMQLGAVKVVPYALGELAHWGNDLTGDELTRAYGQVGVRGSVPFWKLYPGVKSELWNVNGLAHKVTLDADIFFADANQDVDSFPLYDRVDDDSVEEFRRRLKFHTFGLPFGTPVPTRFDERNYAVRSGMQGWVTAPSTEIADDLMIARFGLRQRWQTKRGLPGQERIIDWIVLDLETTLFPDADRDNFGQELGFTEYDFRWHVGDRLTLLSDGYADFFSEGLRTVSIGAEINRPGRGSLYVGFRNFDGPFSANVVSSYFDYRMSEKWIATAGAAVDLSNSLAVGHSVSITRIGESILFSVGGNYDASKDNFGVNLMIEPRFLPGTRRGQIAGMRIPPAGAFGLE